MEYHLTIYGYDSGLNEVLNGVHYDYKTKKIANPTKKKNDQLCMDYLRFKAPSLRGKEIKLPIVIHYKFYCKDKRRDRMNIASAFDKSFEDALQKVGMIPNDGYNDIYGITSDFMIDKDNPRVEIIIQEWDKSKGEPQFWGGWRERNL